MRRIPFFMVSVLIFGLMAVPSFSDTGVVEQLTRYNVTIHTSGKEGAGTNSNISIRFHNTVGYYSMKYPIDTPGDSFERNRWDIMLIDSPKDYGVIESVTLFSSNSGKNTAWLPEWVFVTNMDSGDRYVFKNFKGQFLGGGSPPELKLKVAKTMKLSKAELRKFKQATDKALARQRERAKGKSTWDHIKDGLHEAAEVSDDLGRIGRNLKDVAP